MAFSKYEKKGVTIIVIEKERLDSLIAPDLKTELLLLTDNGKMNILIDLSKVSYADSSGLGALLFGLRQIKNLGGHLRLFGANSKVQNLIKIARLDNHLINYINVDKAIKSFEQD